jgi:general stress protein 26
MCDTFSDLADDFLSLITDIVYCTVTTVDGAGRPRSRVMHPIFEVVEGKPMGWAVTDRTPIKTRHLATNPHVCCFYWSPKQNTVSVECLATWVDDDTTREHVWRVFRETPPPLGWGDLGAYEPERIHHPLFHPLQLTPWRVQILSSEQMAAGDFHPRSWRTAVC